MQAESTDLNGNPTEPTYTPFHGQQLQSGSTISLESSRSSINKRGKAQPSWRVIPSGFVRPARAMNGFKSREKKKISTVSLEPKTLVDSASLLGSIGSINASYITEKLKNGTASSPEEDLYSGFEFPFENLVFEGGGNKGMAYVGALQVLETAGVMKKIKRVAGASAGAIIATLIALDFDAHDLKEFLEQDLRRILVDHSCGYCSLLPNLLKGFGWNPGRKLMRWFGEQLKERTGDADVTFREVLERFGKELCIVVTNLNQMSVEYFHPKTNPNMPVRRAVRMSIALPGVFQCVREINNDYEDVYVDGGLLCNYPIHAFDGWWLSMDPKDSFFKRLQPLEDFARLFEKSERFGTWNKKTLGIVLFSHTETELMKTLLTERAGNKPPRKPVTKLARQRMKVQQKQIHMREEHATMVGAVGRFMKELQRNNLDQDSIINLKELRGVFKKPVDFSRKDAELLFGENVEYRSAFEELDTDEDGEITFQELMAFIEKKGVNLQTRFLGYSRKEIRHLGDFIQTLQTALSVNVKRVYVEKKDVERTIGIDTDYIETNDFYLEPGDVQFLIESGRRATRAFLREYATRETERSKPKPLTPVAEPVEVISASSRPRNHSIISTMSNASVSSLGDMQLPRLKTPNTLPPIQQQSPPEKTKCALRGASAESGESVRSTRKVDVEVSRSSAGTKGKGRTAKVSHMTPV